MGGLAFGGVGPLDSHDKIDKRIQNLAHVLKMASVSRLPLGFVCFFSLEERWGDPPMIHPMVKVDGTVASQRRWRHYFQRQTSTICFFQRQTSTIFLTLDHILGHSNTVQET